ncbi:MAG: OB-fold nucleic acid binding domain-containing protein, partial [Candidatus Scatosoma sp.]
MNVTQEFLQKIRALSGMQNAIVSNIDVFTSRKTVCFYLVTDLPYPQSVLPEAEKIANGFLPQGFTAAAKIEKKTPDGEMIRCEIMRFMKSRFPAASAFLEEKYIEVEKRENGALFRFTLASGEQALFRADNVLDEVAKHLSSTYCGTYFGDVKVAEKQRGQLEEEIIEEADVPGIRVFPVTAFEKIDGAEPQPKYATYIADCNGESTDTAVCGRIVNISERESKKGKAFYSVTVDDGTGSVRGAYFPKKATVEKIAALKAGETIVCSGDFELFNGYLSFNVKKIDRGAPPEGFVPEKLQGRKVP